MSPISELSALEGTYFPSTITPHTEDSSIELIVDGRAYFERIAEDLHTCLAAQGSAGSDPSGDFVYVMNWVFDPETWLGPHPPAQLQIGEALAQLQAAGVDVRVLLNGGTSSIAALRSPCPQNRKGVAWMLDHGVANTVLDKTGTLRACHHDKAVIVGTGQSTSEGTLIAYLGGIDFGLNRIDEPSHPRIVANATGETFEHCADPEKHPADPKYTQAWHDMGVRISGPCAADVWKYFADRWQACAYAWNSGKETARWFARPPGTVAGSGAVKEPSITHPPFEWFYRAAPEPVPELDPTQSASLKATVTPDTGMSCTVLRSVDAAKCEDWKAAGLEDVPEQIIEVRETISKAIAAAKHYVYIEDQSFPIASREWWLVDCLHELTYPVLRSALLREIPVICVHGIPDPGDGLRESSEPARDMKREIIENLAYRPAALERFALYKVHCITVHSKLVIVDDQFISIGSANFFDASWMGLNSECNLGAVTDTTNSTIRDFRIRLWAEHAGCLPKISNADGSLDTSSTIYNQLLDPVEALGMWRTNWRSSGQTFAFDKQPLAPPGPRLEEIYPSTY